MGGSAFTLICVSEYSISLLTLRGFFGLQELSVSIQPPVTITYGEEFEGETMYKLPHFKEAFKQVMQLVNKRLHKKKKNPSAIRNLTLVTPVKRGLTYRDKM